MYRSYVAIGDSFTEGVGDDTADCGVRGWADLVALGLALASPQNDADPVTYANLAIRGRLLAPIVGDQLDAGIALAPELMSINGGGNDIMRPRVSIAAITDQLVGAVEKATASGCHVLLVSGANPTRHIPLGSFIHSRGEQFARGIRERLPLDGVTWVDNWADSELAELRYWSRDKLHLNPLGHQRVAANVLSALGVDPAAGQDGAGVDHSQRTSEYWREYVLPWIGRRLTGRSSGDNRAPKIATLRPVLQPR
jgi:lysophospholipase L1-like esterase